MSGRERRMRAMHMRSENEITSPIQCTEQSPSPNNKMTCAELLRMPNLNGITSPIQCIEQRPNINIVVSVIKKLENRDITLITIPKNLRHVKEIFRIMVKRGHCEIVKEMDSSIHSDVKFIKSLVQLNPRCYEHLPEIYHDNEEITKLAISTSFVTWLRFASVRLRSDPKMHEYIESFQVPIPYGSLIDYAPLKERNYIKASIAERIAYAHPSLLSDADFMREIIAVYPAALKHASPTLLDNDAFMRDVITNRPSKFEYASDRLRSDKDFVKFALELDTSLIIYVNPELWNAFSYLF